MTSGLGLVALAERPLFLNWLSAALGTGTFYYEGVSCEVLRTQVGPPRRAQATGREVAGGTSHFFVCWAKAGGKGEPLLLNLISRNPGHGRRSRKARLRASGLIELHRGLLFEPCGLLRWA